MGAAGSEEVQKGAGRGRVGTVVPGDGEGGGGEEEEEGGGQQDQVVPTPPIAHDGRAGSAELRRYKSFILTGVSNTVSGKEPGGLLGDLWLIITQTNHSLV